MKLICLNLKHMLKNNIAFVIMLFVTIAVGGFALLFSVGVLYNNQYVSMEDALTNKKINIGFSEHVLWEENSDAFAAVCEIFEDYLGEFTVMGLEYDTNGEEKIFSSLAYFCDGTFVDGPSIKRIISYQIDSGRNLDYNDFVYAKNVALVTSDIDASYVSFGEKEYEVVGVRNTEGLGMNMITLPLTAWGNNPIVNVNIDLNRLPTYMQYKSLKKILDKEFADNYTLGDYYGKDVELKAMYRTIGLVAMMIIVIVIITLFYIIGYLYEGRSIYIAIYRLLGCNQLGAIVILVAETFTLASIAGLAGISVFEGIRKIWLNKYYVYMDELFNFKFYFAGFFCFMFVILLEIICMSVVFVHKTIKSELLEAS